MRQSLLVSALLLILFAAPANTSAAEAVEPVDDVEVIDEVEVVDAVDATDAASESPSGFTLTQIVGRNHPATVHLPIGLLLAVVLIELMSLFYPQVPLGKSGLVLAVVTALSLLPAVLSGFLRAGEMFNDRTPPELLTEHRNLMIAMTVVFLSALVLRIVKKDRLEGALRYIYVGMLVLAFLLIAVGGHHGGQLVYGENFLPY